MQNVTGSASAADAVAAEKPSLKARALDELRRYAIITLYLWVFFALFSFYRRMILEENESASGSRPLAIVNALVFGKVILIAQALNLEADCANTRASNRSRNSFIHDHAFAFHSSRKRSKPGSSQPPRNSIADFGGGTLSGFLTIARSSLSR